MPAPLANPEAAPDRKIRIAIADLQTLFRAGLRKLLSAEEDFEVVAETDRGPEILPLVEHLKPDLLLLDLNLRDLAGLDVLHQWQALEPRLATRILVLTDCQEEAKLAEAMEHGASGVALKTTPTNLLMEAIRKVFHGEIWLDGNVSARVIKNLAEPRSVRHRGQQDSSGLTPREREIAALVGQGYKYREIAALLSISEQTVKNHLRNMFDKLGVSDRLQLALYAIHHNL